MPKPNYFADAFRAARSPYLDLGTAINSTIARYISDVIDAGRFDEELRFEGFWEQLRKPEDMTDESYKEWLLEQGAFSKYVDNVKHAVKDQI